MTAAALFGGVVGGVVGALLAGDGAGNADQESPTSTTALQVEVSDAIAEAAARAAPAVVRIESATRRELDVGSGVIISAEGYIVTNAHVVLGTDQLKAVFPDGSERPAVLIGHDYPFNDVAVLQVAPVGLTVMEVGDSTELRVGQTVLAIGNPLGELYGAVTVGVISGLGRSRVSDGVRRDDIIQTDAAINSGNSGGALVNLAGQFIGMPTSVLRQTGSGQSVQGVAFAIPSNRVMAIARQIIQAQGPIPRPSLEAEHLDLTDEVAARLPALATDSGAVILNLASGGAAARAGIRAGDVIIQVGDRQVDRSTPLLNALEEHAPGETVKVVLNRNGRIIETEVRLAKRS
ncbi:S1C family serine protease [Tepidiforma sp.]|uniref:S1C family serine protease n=1 Tax=Tepidiforma sp. TaxID=2682230 RepID=UPI002ADD46F1|nr:trypsin-like peptidase domain-containing protein [Tepidiforma sp.]